MQSTSLMFDILELVEVKDKPETMKLLKRLRFQVADETKKALFKRFNLNRQWMVSDYSLLIKQYGYGT